MEETGETRLLLERYRGDQERNVIADPPTRILLVKINDCSSEHGGNPWKTRGTSRERGTRAPRGDIHDPGCISHKFFTTTRAIREQAERKIDSWGRG